MSEQEFSIILPEDIPLPPEDIPLPPEDIPLPPEDIPLPPEDIPLPPEDIPLPPESIPPPEDGRQLFSIQTKEPSGIQRPLSHSPPHTTSKRKRIRRDNLDDVDCESNTHIEKMMGFSSFNTTKGKMVPGNQSVGAVHVVKKQRCRQYMNRKGGFNRPLDKTA